MQALDMYPRSPELLAALAEAETRAHTPSRLRSDLAAAAAAAPSPFTWLLTLRCEGLRAAATLRLQVRAGGRALITQGESLGTTEK